MIIRVYKGYGSAQNGTPILINEFKRHLDADVAGISENEMKTSKGWLRETSLIVFAGKSVGAFKEALGPIILGTLKQSITEGAFDYMGICAGAAFASAGIKYRMKPIDSGKTLVIRNTGLSLSDIFASGPCREVSPLPFSGGSDDLKLITLRSTADWESYKSFHWGGPALIPTQAIQPSRGRALSFLKDSALPMSLHFKCGEGNVTLCSHHPEINAENIGVWAEARFIPKEETTRLETLAKELDGTAFKRLLEDAGLKQYLIPHLNAA